MWPANYNCPGQIVVSGEHEAVEECCAEAESLGARRAVSAEGLRRVPQPARREGGRPASAGARPGELRRAALALHVDGDGQDRAGAEARDAARRPAHRARCGSPRRPRSSSGAERRPSSKSGLGTCSPVSSSASTAASRRSRSTRSTAWSARRKLSRGERRRSARSREERHSSPARRAGSAARSRLELAAGGASVVLSYRTGADEARRAGRGDRRPRRAGGRLGSGVGAGARRGGGRPRHPREQRGRHARRAPRPHVGRRLARP